MTRLLSISLLLVSLIAACAVPRPAAAAASEPEVSQQENELIGRVTKLAEEDPAQAALELRQAITPASSAALDMTLGVLLAKSGDRQGALESFMAALKKNPGFARARLNAASALIGLSRSDEAVRLLMEDRSGTADNAHGLVMLGGALETSMRPVPAETAYRQALLLAPDSAQALEGLVRCLLAQARYAEAAAIAEDLLARDPESAGNWLLLANAEIGNNDYRKAASALECGRRLGKLSGRNLALLADLYLNLGQTGQALDAYTKALERGNSGLTAARMLDVAEGFMSMDEAQTAERIADMTEKLMKAEGFVPDAEQSARLNWLKAVIAESEGDAKKAEELLKTVLADRPAHVQAMLALGGIYQTDGRNDEAEMMFERAVRAADGADVQACMLLASLYARTGRPEKAVETMETAAGKNPSPEARSYLEQLRAYAKQLAYAK